MNSLRNSRVFRGIIPRNESLNATAFNSSLQVPAGILLTACYGYDILSGTVTAIAVEAGDATDGSQLIAASGPIGRAPGNRYCKQVKQ